MLTKRQKSTAIKTVQRHDTDTGSAEVQVAIISKRIDSLASHLKKSPKDNHSRRGLLQLVADRRKHMKYLVSTNEDAHAKVLAVTGLKK